jgi:SAM-dependent methyltransferase
MKELLYGIVPTSLRIQGISYFRNLALDFLDVLRQQQDPGLPPRRLNYSGAGDFRQVGENNLMLCCSAGGLQRHHRVLDIGCGVGRTAMAMAQFLKEPGSYTGFDAMKSAVQWCQKHVHCPAARFEFVHADLLNKMYNPHGRIRSELYSFPVDNESKMLVSIPTFAI